MDKKHLDERCRTAIRLGLFIGKGEAYAEALIKEIGAEPEVPFAKGTPEHLLALLEEIKHPGTYAFPKEAVTKRERKPLPAVSPVEVKPVEELKVEAKEETKAKEEAMKRSARRTRSSRRTTRQRTKKD